MSAEPTTYDLIRKKDKLAPRRLFERYGKKLSGYAQKAWKLDEDDAWDLSYKTLEKVMKTADQYTFESEQRFSSFVYKVFINYLRNHYRDTKSNRPEFVDLNDDLHGAPAVPEKENKESDAMKLLNEELDKLEDWQRILLLMRSQDMPYSAIAQFVDKPEDQLKVYYQRLKKQLTDTMNAKLNLIPQGNANV
jgi:RNA polymerase sigma factor (sigma-70 family)